MTAKGLHVYTTQLFVLPYSFSSCIFIFISRNFLIYCGISPHGRHCVVTCAIWLQSGSPPFIHIINSGPGRSDCLPARHPQLSRLFDQTEHGCVRARAVCAQFWTASKVNNLTTFLQLSQITVQVTLLTSNAINKVHKFLDHKYSRTRL